MLQMLLTATSEEEIDALPNNVEEESTSSSQTETDQPTVVDREPLRGENKSLMSTIAIAVFTVGLGSMWRFPYYCYKNEGGKSFYTLFEI